MKVLKFFNKFHDSLETRFNSPSWDDVPTVDSADLLLDMLTLRAAAGKKSGELKTLKYMAIELSEANDAMINAESALQNAEREMQDAESRFRDSETDFEIECAEMLKFHRREQKK